MASRIHSIDIARLRERIRAFGSMASVSVFTAAAAAITGLAWILDGRYAGAAPLLLIAGSLAGYAAGTRGGNLLGVKWQPDAAGDRRPGATDGLIPPRPPERESDPPSSSDPDKTPIRRLNHEVLNFLNEIDMITYGLRHERLTPRGEKILAILGKESRRMKRFMQQFRLFVRDPEPRLQTSPLEVVIGDAVDHFRPEAESTGIGIRIDWPADIPPVRVDPVLAGQVFEQLIQNGIDAVGSSGTIAISGRIAGEWLLVTVSDTGPGIAPDIRDHLFEPFAAAPGSAGTGLGLAIAKKIIEAHGGTIEAADHPESGAAFAIRLPV